MHRCTKERAQWLLSALVLLAVSSCLGAPIMNTEGTSPPPSVAPEVPVLGPESTPAPSNPYLPELEGVRIAEVKLVRKNIYDDDQKPAWIFQTINRLHVVTQELVIERELLLHEGDVYDPELAEETERILRALPFLTDARVYPVPRPDGDADLYVETRDRFTLRIGGSFGLFGGSTTSRLALGEENLFGLGKEFALRYKQDDEEEQYGFAYKDPQFLSSHHVFRLSADDSDEGGNFAMSLVEPFRSLEDDLSYGVDVEQDRRDVGYSQFGSTFAEVPQRATRTGAFYTRAYGPRKRRLKLGVRAAYEALRFGQAFGANAASLRVPGNTRRFETGPTVSLEFLPRFAELQQLDAMGLVEDVPMGFIINGFVGWQRQDEKHQSLRNEAVLALETRYAVEVGGRHLMTLGTGARQRIRAGDSPGFASTTQVHYYYFGLPYQTLAASVAFDVVREEELLPAVLSLGEDNGLRGYDSSFFNGDRRVRINLENRVFPDLEILSVQLGGVVFFDAGLAWDRRESVRASDLYRSVGFGLRLSSPELVRREPVRIDLAFPLDDHPAEDFSLSLSVSVGQVFSVFGNAEGFDRRF